ncbi:MAG: 50S ribosomal protein L4 [Candidatus Babeliales bacterium]
MNAQKKTNEMQEMKNNLTQVLTHDILVDAVKSPVREVAFSTWIRQILQNWRQGTVSSKGRADVSFSNKKPWKQKGTGRARAGSARSPLWRGGGTTFGPQPRTRTLKVSKKLRKGVLNNLLWDAIDNKNLICLDWTISNESPKTAAAYTVLKQADLLNKKVNLLLPIDDTIHYASFINIPNVSVLSFDEVNAYDLALADKWIVLKKDLDAFKQMVNSWL